MKGGTRVSTLGPVGGRQPLHLQVSGARAGLPGGLPGYPTLTWAASALFLGPSDVHTHAPRHTRLLTHTCTHADRWSLDPEGTRPGAFRGQLGTCRPLACAWSPLPPPAHLPRLQRAGTPPSGGWGLKPQGPQRLSHLPVKQHQAKSCCASQQSRTGLPGEQLSPQNTGETFLKIERSADSDSAAVAVCRLFPVRDFFYSIFLAVFASLFAEGWERPSVSGTRLSLVCQRRPRVPCVPCLAPPRLPPPASPAWLTGRPQVPSWPSPHSQAPWERVGQARSAWGGCAVAGFCSVPRWEGP